MYYEPRLSIPPFPEIVAVVVELRSCQNVSPC
jgi:hypothetical protein